MQNKPGATIRPVTTLAVILTGIGLSGAGASAGAAEKDVPPGYTMERKGTPHDFDYFEGGWTTVQHRMKDAASGKDEWTTFPGNECMNLYLDGYATFDELYFPTLKRGGVTLRTFDKETHQWSIYWVNSATGRLDPIPTVGGFDGKRGEFYAEDKLGDKPIKVRYLWLIEDQDHARWEQAFSFDNKTWVTNWTAEFTRADEDAVCEKGRVKR